MKFMSSLKGIFFVLLSTLMFAGVPDWDCDGDGTLDNYNDYQNNGSVNASISLDGSAIGQEGDMLAAFVGDEQRGVAQALAIPPQLGGGFGFLILCYSNETSAEMLTFKFYNSEDDMIYNISEDIEFVADMTIGNVVMPQELNITDISTDAYVSCEGECDDADTDGICDDIDDCVGAYDE